MLIIYKFNKNDLARQIKACWDSSIEIIIDSDNFKDSFIIRDDYTEIKSKPFQVWTDENFSLEMYLKHIDTKGKPH